MDSILGLGLDAEEAQFISALFEPLGKLRTLPASPALDCLAGRPELLLVPWRVWRELDSDGRDRLMRVEDLPLVLLLGQDQLLAPSEVEEIASAGFLTVSSKLDQEWARDVLLKARESVAVMHDIAHMTREIALEREILSRKITQLEFLSRLLTRTSETLEIPLVLDRTAEELQELLDLDSLCAVAFQPIGPGLVEAELHVPSDGSREDQEEWIDYLLNGAARLSGCSVSSYTVSFGHVARKSTAPGPGRRMLLPLSSGKEPFGALALVSGDLPSLGSDKLQTLSAAVSHVSQVLRNAFLYSTARKLADHDGLTRIHNRQHFDKTLLVELKRHQRQGESLSLLMLDLDHFKAINDRYGHQAGDMVLKEVGRLLTATLRESDYPARYGGEEFVVVLPHTTEEQAWKLAERIRTKLASTRFEYHGQVFRVTTSIGIAGIAPNALHPAPELIRLADNALYRAKAGGRNMVCISAPPRESSLAC
jgi:diguanylate cyclase (GGDEF)-like protein